MDTPAIHSIYVTLRDSYVNTEISVPALYIHAAQYGTIIADSPLKGTVKPDFPKTGDLDRL